MKYDRAHEMFYDMMSFALRNGMTSYQSDLMYDATMLCRIEDMHAPANLTWIVKSNGCGTWVWNHIDGEMPEYYLGSGTCVEIAYSGNHWIADFA